MTCKKILCLLLVLSIFACTLIGCKRNEGGKKGNEETSEEDGPKPTEDPSQKESALAVVSAARDFLSSVNSYRETVTTKISFPYTGVTLTVKNTDDARYYAIEDTDGFYCEQTSTQTTSFGGAEKTEMSRSGYQNGKMYQSDGKNELCSAISADDYKAYLSLDTEQKNYLSELEGSEKVGYEKVGDGYRVTLAELSKEKIALLKDKFLTLENLIENAFLTSVSVSVKLDADGRPQETKMNFRFSSDKVSMSVVSTYGEWNAVPSSPSVDISSYEATGDLRKITEVSDALEALKQTRTVTFTLNERTTKEAGVRTTTETTDSTVTVSTSPSYCYTIAQTKSTGATLDFSYRNGKETIVTRLFAGGDIYDTQEKEMSESDAKAKISSLLSVGDLPSQGVASVSVGENTVTFVLSEPETNAVEENYVVLSSTAMLEVRYDGDKITSYTYSHFLEGTDMYSATAGVSLTIAKTVTFE